MSFSAWDTYTFRTINSFAVWRPVHILRYEIFERFIAYIRHGPVWIADNIADYFFFTIFQLPHRICDFPSFRFFIPKCLNALLVEQRTLTNECTRSRRCIVTIHANDCRKIHVISRLCRTSGFSSNESGTIWLHDVPGKIDPRECTPRTGPYPHMRRIAAIRLESRCGFFTAQPRFYRNATVVPWISIINDLP